MNKNKIISVLIDIAKIISFLSLVMTVVIKTRILLGLPNGVKTTEKANEN